MKPIDIAEIGSWHERSGNRLRFFSERRKSLVLRSGEFKLKAKWIGNVHNLLKISRACALAVVFQPEFSAIRLPGPHRIC
jgi:hypothetical protein